MNKKILKEVFSIPNLLSYFRFILAGLFAYIYLNAETDEDYYFATLVIAISGITDFLDGKIARKFNMITEIGKIVDPIADKVTQGVLILCLIHKYYLMIPFIILFIIKESYMGLVGLKVLKVSGKNEGAKWFGKVSTAVFYAVMLVLILFPGISNKMANILITICILLMLNAFVCYYRHYNKIFKDAKRNNKF